MQSLVRGIAALGLAGAVSGIAVARLAADAFPGAAVPGVTNHATGSFYEYRFEELEVFEQTVFHVGEKYVDPSRLDWEAMFAAVLRATEYQVSAAVFTREPGGSKVTVEIGEFLTVLEIDPIGDHGALVDAVREVAALVKAHADGEDLPKGDPDVDPWRELEYAMVNGMLHGTLDPHSSLLPPRAASDMDVENQGEFGGLGVTVSERDGWLTVEATDQGTPAAAVGLRPKDRIVRIDGESTLNMTVDEAVTRLRGLIGAPVTLEIGRDGRDEPLVVDIVRARIAFHPVEGELLEGGVAYVMLPNFHAEAEAQLRRELTRLKRESGGELRGLVLDLRGNPGGFYHEGWKVADAFLSEGTLVSTVDRDGRQVDRKEARSGGTEPKYPIAVLVDPRSASASEIVAGALRNNDRAVIVGRRSFGKGSVQNLHEYHDGSKLKLTVSRYLTPGDRSIQSVGIPADIDLVPAYWNADGDPDRRIALYSAELQTREADLPGALDADALVAEAPAYTLGYLRREAEEPELDPDPQSDFVVRLARDVLLAAPSWRRADVLTSAAAVVARHARQTEAELVEAMELLGLDWSDGPGGDRAGPSPVELKLEPGVLQAGERAEVVLTARNLGETPLYRVAALVTEHDVLGGREFFFGRLDPGQERSWSVRLTPPLGYPSERAPVLLSLRDAGEGALSVLREDLEITAAPRARLKWTVELIDGDGDGRAEVEERLTVKLAVHNVGEGPAVGLVARALNRSGKALDLVQGNLSVGSPVDAEGAPCEPEERGTGEQGCRFVLGAGEGWEGAFEVDVKDHPPSGELGLDLRLEHRRDYDWAAIARAGLDVYASTESLKIGVAQPLPAPMHREQPRIQVTHGPDRVTTGERVSVSGVVTDETGLAHVMIFSGEDKVFHQGSGRTSVLQSIPFTADVPLVDGLNTLVIQALDRDGVQHSASVVTWSGEPDLAKRE